MTENERVRWAERLRTIRYSGRQELSARFFDMIEAAKGGGLAEARILMSTITNQPEDAGQGEAVISILCAYPVDVRVKAIIEEIPRLERDGQQEWSNSLIEDLAKDCRDRLIHAANETSSQTRATLRAVLERVSAGARRRRAKDMALPVIKVLCE